MRRVALSAQVSAVETAAALIDAPRQLRSAERDLIRERLAAAAATLRLLVLHEDEVRETIRDAEAKRRATS